MLPLNLRSRHASLVAAAALTASVLLSGAATAATITYQFTVDIIVSTSASFTNGQSAMGTFSYSDTLPVSQTQGTNTVAYDATGQANITLGGLPSADALDQLFVQDNESGVGDRISLIAANGTSGVQFADPTGNAIGGTAIPTVLNLADYNFMRFDILLADGQVFGTLTSLTQVPEPTLAALLALSTALVFSRTRRD